VGNAGKLVLVSSLLSRGWSTSDPGGIVDGGKLASSFLKYHNAAGNCSVPLGGLDTRIQDAVLVSRLAHHIVVCLSVEGDLTGSVGRFIKEDTSDSGVLGGIKVNIFLYIRNGTCTIGSVDVSDHFYSGVLELGHVSVVSTVRAGGRRSTVGVNDSNGWDFASAINYVIPRGSRIGVQWHQKLEWLSGAIAYATGSARGTRS
jgi:hypothetical protein